MSVTHSIEINATAEQIFAIYKDVSSWTEWDPDLEAVSLQGEFVAGTQGWLKPVDAPKTKTLLATVSEPHAFTVVAKLPLCEMHFNHELEPIGTNAKPLTRTTHSVEFTGLLAPLFSRIVGKKIRATIVAAMRGLKEFAERNKS